MILAPIETPWRAVVLTIHPDMFPGPLNASLAGRSLRQGRWSLETIDIREFAKGAHRSVDDSPAGGGPGMVMRADVVGPALDHALARGPENPLIFLTPRGRPLTQERVRTLAEGPGATLLCGRFEGVDQRVLEAREMEEVSIGDFVLSGGEIAAMTILDAAIRLLPGVIGAAESLREESFESGLLEYPHYTRPREWEARRIPEVLLSGDHARIAEWRRDWSERLTRERRPDLWKNYRKG